MGHVSFEGYEPKHLSYSTINGYRMCGKQFYFSKVARLEERPGLAALGGNAVHTATELIDLAEFFGQELTEDFVREELDIRRSERHPVDTDIAEESEQ